MAKKPYTVAELIHSLKELPQDSVVLISSDAEGNSFHPIDGLGQDRFNKKTWQPAEGADKPSDLVKTVILWPI